MSPNHSILIALVASVTSLIKKNHRFCSPFASTRICAVIITVGSFVVFSCLQHITFASTPESALYKLLFFSNLSLYFFIAHCTHYDTNNQKLSPADFLVGGDMPSGMNNEKHAQPGCRLRLFSEAEQKHICTIYKLGNQNHLQNVFISVTPGYPLYSTKLYT